MRSVWGTLAVCLAALVVLSTLSLQPGARAEDSGATAVEPVVPPQFANLEVRDIAWSANNTLCVVVGIDWSATGNCAFYNDTNTANGWQPLPFIVGANDRLLGVDYDPISNYFVMVGVNTGTFNQLVYLWYPGSTWFTIATPGGAYGAFMDVACIPATRFMAITDQGFAFYYHYLSPTWYYNETKGALPTGAVSLNNVMYDPNDGIVLMSGGSTLTNGCAYGAWTQDLFAERFYAFNVGPNSSFPMFRGGDWCQQYDYGVLAGNRNITKITVDTDPYNWFEDDIYSATSPSARRESTIAYCGGSGKIVLFGGWNGTYMSDTWEYNVFKKTWTKMNPASYPEGRYGHAMAYDKNRMEVILYGGQTSGGLQQDTWTYNITSGIWLNRASSSPLGILRDHAMTFCDSLGRVVCYGGYNAGAKNDMASWGGAAWATMSVGSPGPLTYEHAMAYDPYYNLIVMFGGVGFEGSTYVYNFTTGWAAISPPTIPPSRSGHTAAYSSYLAGVAIYGGQYSGYLDDVWYYNCSANRWYSYVPCNLPAQLATHAMTAGYNGMLYVFGGYNSSGADHYQTYVLGRQLDVNGTVLSDNATKTWYAVCWYPYTATADTEALIVGNDGNISRLDPNVTYIQPMENPYAQLGRHLYAVGCKAPTSPGYAFALGSPGGGVKINQVSAGSQVTVGADVPHVVWLNLNNSAGSPINNGKINVDSGSYSSYVVMDAEIYSKWGTANFTQIDLYGWHDGGSTGVDQPVTMGNGFDAPGAENLRLHYRYTVAGGILAQVYPNHPGDLESVLWNGNSFYNPFNFTSAWVRFSFWPMKQFRHAPGPPVWTEPAGSRYSYAVNGQENASALNDPYSWDFKLKVTLADGMNSSAYEELGVYKYTYIGAGNLPGDQSGSGPPGGTVYLAPTGNVSFVSNCNYSLKVYMDGLLRGVNDANRTMPASALGVMGGDLQNWSVPGTQAHFNGTGSANALYLFAWSGGYLSPRAADVLTHTGQGAVGTVGWRCIVPMGTAEDRYSTTVTFVLEHD